MFTNIIKQLLVSLHNKSFTLKIGYKNVNPKTN